MTAFNPITVAGLRRIFTGFPLSLYGTEPLSPVYYTPFTLMSTENFGLLKKLDQVWHAYSVRRPKRRTE
jgi:hypothetical protein